MKSIWVSPLLVVGVVVSFFIKGVLFSPFVRVLLHSFQFFVDFTWDNVSYNVYDLIYSVVLFIWRIITHIVNVSISKDKHFTGPPLETIVQREKILWTQSNILLSFLFLLMYFESLISTNSLTKVKLNVNYHTCCRSAW